MYISASGFAVSVILMFLNIAFCTGLDKSEYLLQTMLKFLVIIIIISGLIHIFYPPESIMNEFEYMMHCTRSAK